MQEKKCSWLIVTALQRCAAPAARPAARAELEAAFLAADLPKVGALYAELGVPEAFAAFERESVSRIDAQLAALVGLYCMQGTVCLPAASRASAVPPI
eukprot:SAG22_NODE_2141_length_2948_cov_1.249912_5_plen_98_part_00